MDGSASGRPETAAAAEAARERSAVDAGDGVTVGVGAAAAAVLAECVAGMAVVVADPGGQEGDPVGAVMRWAAAALPGMDGATLTASKAQRLYTAGASEERGVQLNRWQFRAGQGPVVDAATRGHPVLVHDLVAARRWPELRAVAVPRPVAVRSVYCYPLRHAGPAAVATLYAERSHALDQVDSQDVAVVVAAVDLAMAGLAHHVRAGNLERALGTNRGIGTAMGVLMALNRCTEDEAHTTLAGASQALNRKVADVARDVVLTGTMPDLPVASGAARGTRRRAGTARRPAGGGRWSGGVGEEDPDGE